MKDNNQRDEKNQGNREGQQNQGTERNPAEQKKAGITSEKKEIDEDDDEQTGAKREHRDTEHQHETKMPTGDQGRAAQQQSGTAQKPVAGQQGSNFGVGGQQKQPGTTGQTSQPVQQGGQQKDIKDDQKKDIKGGQQNDIKGGIPGKK